MACCLAVLVAGGFMFGLEARQRSGSPPVPSDTHREVINRYLHFLP